MFNEKSNGTKVKKSEAQDDIQGNEINSPMMQNHNQRFMRRLKELHERYRQFFPTIDLNKMSNETMDSVNKEAGKGNCV